MAEVKISELSVGDWVRVDDFDKVLIKRVSAIDGTRNQIGIIKNNRGGIYWYCDDEIEPILLTPEILEKNGFERGEYSEIRVYNEWEIGEWSNPPYVSVRLDIDRQVIRVTNRGRDMFIADKEVYVHQLQHALRLAGVEKEIEL